MKPIVYLAAFRRGAALDNTVADEPISVSTGLHTPPKWIHNYDEKFKGLIPVRQALAESRNAATIRMAQRAGLARSCAPLVSSGSALPCSRTSRPRSEPPRCSSSSWPMPIARWPPT